MRQFSQRGDLVRLQDSRDPFQHQPADEKHAGWRFAGHFFRQLPNYRRRYLACNIESVLDGVVN